MMRQVYHRMQSTRRFYVTNECISCGLCERLCPVHAIELKEGAPVWVKPKCLKCTACINNCPKAAIQYGHGTQSRHRYHHPDIFKHK